MNFVQEINQQELPKDVNVTYNNNKNGQTPEDIQRETEIPERMLYSHLAFAIKAGYPVDCLKLGVKMDDVEKVIHQIKIKYNGLLPRLG